MYSKFSYVLKIDLIPCWFWDDGGKPVKTGGIGGGGIKPGIRFPCTTGGTIFGCGGAWNDIFSTILL